MGGRRLRGDRGADRRDPTARPARKRPRRAAPVGARRRDRDGHEDDRFDRVLSVFGVQFAPRHLDTAAELVRVCKPGGEIGVVNWTPQSPVGGMFEILKGYLPPAPAFASPPPLWGDEIHVCKLFVGLPVELEFMKGSTPFRFDSGEHFIAFFEAHYGPLVKARERLSGEGTWEECRTRIARLLDDHSVADDRLDAPSEYLTTVARKHHSGATT